ncbi:Anaerobic selenate reductase molybdenum cofactor-containing periplasmic protein / YnfE [Salmonella enterica subsp. enterica serovar Dublin]|nr:Anaerobic selenate reductase molybdenum cofactor-containing periplasmic protein / YnfE [Salmonella enterica subsp. enterica serovar Dublin]
MPGEKQQTGVSRRTLVKSAALGSLALAAGGVFFTVWDAYRGRGGAAGYAQRRR